MESAANKTNNAFLNYLVDSVYKHNSLENAAAINTTDGDFVSEGAIDKALKAGKGLLIGGFFVGSLNNDFNCSYAL